MGEADQNLAALKHDPLFPFINALKDQRQYLSLELYWLYLFKTVIADNLDAAWRAWHLPDLRSEGNPIFSAVNATTRRGVRVIHRQRQTGELSYAEGGKYFPFQPFMSRNVLDFGVDDTPILELCVVADVSEESEQRCRHFWTLHCLEARSEQEMEAAIVTYEDEVGMPEAESPE